MITKFHLFYFQVEKGVDTALLEKEPPRPQLNHAGGGDPVGVEVGDEEPRYEPLRDKEDIYSRDLGDNESWVANIDEANWVGFSPTALSAPRDRAIKRSKKLGNENSILDASPTNSDVAKR
ncbi:hypothetical protein V6N13_049108 [Hibiscus sabdariffa]|uniref:Uncharacterized protein n=1 Tax=Hibiscus sabdariffa TaxID=183260 RepID=A0ABR2QYU7_9ROSI